jgi:hypothetical protein
MAQTIGPVQRLKVTPPPILAWVYVGPTPANTEVFAIVEPANVPPEEAQAYASMVDALSSAFAARRDVIINHDTNQALILSVELRAP